MTEFTPKTSTTANTFAAKTATTAKTFTAKTSTTAPGFGGVDYVLRDELLGALLDENGYELFDERQR